MKYLFPLLLVLSGCWNTASDLSRKEVRSLRRETIERKQELTASGQIVLLTTRTVTLENESTGEKISETIEVEPPRVVGSITDLAKGAIVAGASAVGGPAAGAATDMLWQTIAGIGGAGAAAATGKLAIEGRRRRKLEDEIEEVSDRANTLERQRNELIDGMESAKDHMDDSTWKQVRKTLHDNQHDDTIEEVRRRTAK